MKVRAKFFVTSITLFNSPVGTGQVSMSAVYASKPGVNGNACEENKIFGEYTPSATLTMNVQNPAAFAQFLDAFERKESIYLDFSDASE